MRLPARAELPASRRAVRDWVRGFHGEHADDDLVWIGLSPLLAGIQNWGRERYAPEPLSRARKRKLAKRRPSSVDLGWIQAGGCLFLTQTENQRRSLEPVAARIGIEAAPEIESQPELGDDLARRALDRADELVQAAADASLELPLKPVAVYRTMLRAARALVGGEAALETARPRTVVIGSSHGMRQRGLALTARRAGVPSAYLPHAPPIANLELADLPVDLAALRGPAEIERYRSAGAATAGMIAVGNPGIGSAALAPVRKDAPVAFALPTDDEWALERLIELVREALGDEVVASPHPRADRERLHELLPAGWEVWDGRTSDLLASGPPALIQAASGTGLEALALGIPLIDLRFPEEPPNYPYLEDARVAAPASAVDLRDAVAAAREASPVQREELRALASEWVSATGEDAAAAGAEALERLTSEGSRQSPVWDAWGA